jgi:hypothetical protein
MDSSKVLEVMSEWDLSLENAFIQLADAIAITPFLNNVAQKITWDLPMHMNVYLEKVNFFFSMH